jgi:uncharacterized protein (TIGR03492 family)
MRLLCLSNGHGEDIIATKILEQLQQQSPNINLGALPLVGEGYAYKKLNIPIIGKVKQMPSGGFIYMDSRQLLRDVKGGLVKLTLDQYGGIRQWVKDVKKNQDRALILAVGDIVPLLFAWLSGVDYGFVGTAKSEYYLRDDSQWLDKTSAFEKWMGGVYLPWERWLMSRQSCKAIFPRDQLTTQILQNYGIRAFNFGNPMMDDLEECYNHNFNNLIDSPELNFVLLPGSRVPEVYENWQIILNAINYLLIYFSHKKLTFYGAIAKSVPLNILEELLIKNDWVTNNFNLFNASQIDGKGINFIKNNHTIFITQNAYQACLNKGQIAIAMAGTATEQFIGLGKPAITLIGKGPQFNPAFAEAQTRLLGKSIFLLENPEEITNTVRLFNQQSGITSRN